MSRRAKAMIVAMVAVVVAVSLLFTVFQEAIAKRVYVRTGRELEERLSPKLREKYGTDLRYTLQTFWKFYERDLLSRNDLNDVMDKMKILLSRKEISDREIFDFIGYVSRIYTEAINRARSESYPE